MITSTILIIIFVVLDFLVTPLKLLPDVTADSSVVQGITSAVSYMATFNAFLPLATLFLVVAAILAVELGVAVYKIIMWVVRRIPTQS